MITCVIGFHNDGDIIYESVGRLLNVPDVEIIIVDDGSYEPLSPALAVPDNVRVIRLSRNLGIGAAFDRGVAEANGEIILLMGCDVLVQEGWADHVRRLGNEHPKGIVAAACVGVTAENNYQFINPPRAGAEIRLKQDAKSRDKWFAMRNYNDILVGAWLNPVPTEFAKCQCLMGAAYIINKRWYTHIGGFRLFDGWGGLEPYISIKSYLAGGYVATDPTWVTGHIFGINNGERDPMKRRAGRLDKMYFNKLLIAYTCLPDMAKDLDKFLGNAYAIGLGRQLLKQRWGQVQRAAEYNRSIFTEKIDVLGL